MTPFAEHSFVVLPDLAAAAAVADLVEQHEPSRVLRYPSGRPWIFLLGDWKKEDLVEVALGETRVALVGTFSVTRPELERHARCLTDVAQADRLADTLPGSFHLLASVGDSARVQGTASGLRRVYHAAVRAVTIASDRADLLAFLASAGLDHTRLALRLSTGVPHPLQDLPPWADVHLVPPGAYLALRHRDGTPSLRTWWQPPEPTLPLTDGAARLRDVLADAVAIRTAPGGVVSADLSGGLDSTPLCFLAAQGPAELVTFTMTAEDPLDDDPRWARRAVAALQGVRHHFDDQQDLPAFYEGLGEVSDPLDLPCIAIPSIPRFRAALSRMSPYGSRIHLTGNGGDHVTWGLPTHFATGILRRPLRTARALHTYRVLRGWPVRPIVRSLVDRPSYPEWLARTGQETGTDTPSRRLAILTWGERPAFPPWMSRDAIDAVRDALRQAVTTAAPLAATPGAHREMHMVRFGAETTRGLHQMARRVGLPMESPYFDDRVVEACFAIRPEERADPLRFKPVLKEAMKDVLPLAFQTRNTKGSGATQEAEALRRHIREIRALWDDAHVGRLGLVNMDALHAACSRPSSPALLDGALLTTLSCEMWLRTQPTSAASPHSLTPDHQERQP